MQGPYLGETVSDHPQSSFFGLAPKASNIIRAEGASHPSDHQRNQ